MGACTARLLLVGCAMIVTGKAAQAASFDLAAQPAKTGIPAFARQAGIQIIAPARLLADERTAALKGDFSVQEGLTRLLQGTRLTVIGTSGQTILVGRQATSPDQLPASVQTSERYQRRAPIPLAISGEDIVVTAQRRLEDLRDMPAWVSAVSGDILRQRNVNEITDLGSSFANININSAAGISRITIRGIGTSQVQPNNEAEIAYHVDGVYVSRPEATTDSLYDIDRIEVLRGPQGALYGRNATGGAINVITKDPTDAFEGYGELTGGNYATLNMEGAVSGPLASGVSGRLAFQVANRDGYGRDGNGDPLEDQSTQAARAKLRFVPLDNLAAMLAVDYFREQDAAGGLNYIRPGDSGMINIGEKLGGTVARNTLRDTEGLFPTRTSKENWSSSLNMQWKAADELTVTSITGYRSTDYSAQRDFDSTSYDAGRYFQTAKGWQFSTELRAEGQHGKLAYLIGGYYYQDNLTFRTRVLRNRTIFGENPPGLVQGFHQRGTLKTQAAAVFGQLTYEIGPDLRIDIGGRYSIEWKKDVNDIALTNNNAPFNDAIGPFDPSGLPVAEAPGTSGTAIPYQDDKFDNFTPSVTVRYEFQPSSLLFLTYSQGFKSGGYALGSGGASYKPSILDNYEAGVKANFGGGIVQSKISLFYYKYSSIQVTKINPMGGSNIVESAGSAKLRGLEASLVLSPLNNVRLDADLGLLDAKYDTYSTIDPNRISQGMFDLTGNDMVQAPRYMLNLGAQYLWQIPAGNLTLRGEASIVDRIYFSPFNTVAYSQSGYAIYDVYMSYEAPSGCIYGTVFIKNLTDRDVLASAAGNPISMGGTVVGLARPPRTYGIRFGFRI